MDMHVLGASRTSGGGDGGCASDDYMRESGKTGMYKSIPSPRMSEA